MKIVGLTGEIASGKTIISDYLQEKKYKIFDADKIVEEIYTKESFIVEIEKKIPEIIENNKINKQKLSDLAFFDQGILHLLERILHPLVKKELDNFLKKNIDEDLLFLDIALLFENGLDKKCDYVIYIKTSKELQQERFLLRNKGSLDKLAEILKKQRKFKNKENLANWVLNNIYKKDRLFRDLENIISNLLKK